MLVLQVVLEGIPRNMFICQRDPFCMLYVADKVYIQAKGREHQEVIMEEGIYPIIIIKGQAEEDAHI